MQHDHMIEALTTNGSNHSLDIGPLPRRAGCRQDLADAHISQLFSEIMAENGITVAQQVARKLSEGKGLAHLLSRPLCSWVGGNIEVQNATPVMGQHQKHVENLEADRRHSEEIDGGQLLHMIVKECPPVLRGHFVSANHVFADAALSDVEAKFEQLAVNARCTPQGILPAHLADQVSDLTQNNWSSGLAVPYLPSPEQAKGGAMPSYDGFRLNDGQRRAPVAPEAGRQIQNRRSLEVNFARFAADL